MCKMKAKNIGGWFFIFKNLGPANRIRQNGDDDFGICALNWGVNIYTLNKFWLLNCLFGNFEKYIFFPLKL